MVVVMNKLRQPLAVDGDEKAVHFLSREKKELTTEEFNSKGIQEYIDKNKLLVLEINE